MKKFFNVILIAIIVITQSAAFAAEPPKGIPAGGKGATEVAAIEDMKLSIIKRILARNIARSEDSDSSYQQMIQCYRESIDSVKVETKGKISSGGVFVTGRVIIKYEELQAELKKIIASSHKNEEGKKVYVFVRFVGGTSETQNREAEKSILSRYKNRLETNRFNVITDDTINLNLSQTRSMSFEEFIGWVKDQFEEELADLTKIQKDYKAKLKTAMRENGVKSWDAGRLRVSYTPASTSDNFDTKKFQADHPELYSKYIKTVPKADSIRVTIREDKS